VRLSGPRSLEILGRIFRPKVGAFPSTPFQLRLGYIVDPDMNEVLDEVLVSFMKAPFSYTREDMVEINSHSGIQVISNILNLTLRQGARLARPGEFTYRAFMNGRINLTQAEAVLDLINARSKEGLSIAISTLEGGLSDKIKMMREELGSCLSELEALIDFPEEEVEVDLEALGERVQREALKIQELLEANKARKIWMEGIHVVIAGQVNAGKSSLLNRIVEAPKAIVTAIPGTTRDLLEVPYILEGIPVKLVDTAGIGTPKDEAERIGIERAKHTMDEADIVLVVVDQSEGLRSEDLNIWERVKDKAILVMNKCDLALKVDPREVETRFKGQWALVSALTGEGIPLLKQKIRDRLLAGVHGFKERLCPNLRQAEALRNALKRLEEFKELSQHNSPLDILAQPLWEALRYLDEITGNDVSQEVLDKIFSSFCIGK
jgi:tRNA modification GTPase